MSSENIRLQKQVSFKDVCHNSTHYQKKKNFILDCSIITFEYRVKFEHNSLVGLNII